jgi:hypothetical protein
MIMSDEYCRMLTLMARTPGVKYGGGQDERFEQHFTHNREIHLDGKRWRAFKNKSEAGSGDGLSSLAEFLKSTAWLSHLSEKSL